MPEARLFDGLWRPQVVPELNDGQFTAQPLSGRLKKVTGPAAALTLGGLTFGAVKPADLEVRQMD